MAISRKVTFSISSLRYLKKYKDMCLIFNLTPILVLYGRQNSLDMIEFVGLSPPQFRELFKGLPWKPYIFT